MHSKIIIVAVVIAIIVSLSILWWLVSESNRRTAVRKVALFFCQAIVDNDYEKAVSFCRKDQWNKTSLENHTGVCLNRVTVLHPDFKEFKSFSLTGLYHDNLGNVSRQNRYIVMATFYGTDSRGSPSVEMTLHIDKVDSEYKILDFYPPMGLLHIRGIRNVAAKLCNGI